MAARHSRVSVGASYAAAGEPARPVQFGYEARLEGHAAIHRLGRWLPTASADLIEIAATIHVVDRLVARPTRLEFSAGSTWSRDLWLKIPVREPQLWRRHVGLLAEMLAWLTDDTWILEFTQLPGGTGPLDEAQSFLFDTVPERAASVLFSGGLDSAAGLATHLNHAGAVAISVETNNCMQCVQQRVREELNAVSLHACVPLRYRVNMHARDAETSQRSRGLLFLAAGIATAWTIRQDRLLIFENGIGAINLPYLHSQAGSQAARAMHPKTLRMAQDLATAVSGRPFRVDAPAMTMTKAGLIMAAPVVADHALSLTVSCDKGFAARVAGHAFCGTCTSCLLRRQALHAAGKASLDAADSYRTNCPERSDELAAMLWQVARIRACLANPDPWPALVSEFPEILDTAPLTPTEVISLYGSYVREWGDVGRTLTTGRAAA